MPAWYGRTLPGEWVRWRRWHAPAADLGYWRAQTGPEVDLVVDHDRRYTSVECTPTQRPVPGDTRGIERFRAIHPGDLAGCPFPGSSRVGYRSCSAPDASQVVRRPGSTR